MNVVKAAIIDDGVNCTVSGAEIEHWEIREDGEAMECGPAPASHETHGTSCFKIIRRLCGSPEPHWDSVKILDTAVLRSNVDKLLAALSFCEGRGCRLIHLSIGSTNWHDRAPISKKIRELQKKGIVVVAATSNRACLTYPACLPGVIGVASLDCGDFEFTYKPCAPNLLQIDFLALSRHELQQNAGGGTYTTEISNSFAAPVITAECLKILAGKQELSAEALRRELINRSGLSDVDMGGHESIRPWKQSFLRESHLLESLLLPVSDRDSFLSRKSCAAQSPVVCFYGKSFRVAEHVRQWMLQMGYAVELIEDTGCELPAGEGWEEKLAGILSCELLLICGTPVTAGPRWHADLRIVELGGGKWSVRPDTGQTVLCTERELGNQIVEMLG